MEKRSANLFHSFGKIAYSCSIYKLCCSLVTLCFIYIGICRTIYYYINRGRFHSIHYGIGIGYIKLCNIGKDVIVGRNSSKTLHLAS